MPGMGCGECVRTPAGRTVLERSGYVRRLTFSSPVLRWMNRLPPEVGLSAVVLMWGLNFAIIKVPLATIPPFTVNALRFAISVAVLGAIHLALSRSRGVRPTITFAKAGVWPVVAMGVLGHVSYQMGFILGLSRTTAGGAALLIAASPLVTAVAGHALGVDRLRAAGWIGAGLSLVGVVLVVLGRPAGGVGGDAVGVAFLLFAAASWGLATVYSRTLLDRGATPVGLTFWSLVAALPVLVALAVPEFSRVAWAEIDAAEWLAILYSGSLSTGLAYGLWNTGVQQVGPSRAAAFSNLTPFVGVAAGVVLLGEPAAWLQMVGGAVIVAGIVVMRRSPPAPLTRAPGSAAGPVIEAPVDVAAPPERATSARAI